MSTINTVKAILTFCFFNYLTICHSSSIQQPHQINKRSSDDLKIVCYYSNWAIYRSGLAKFTPQNINPYLCTHLIYAFGGLSSKYELKAFDPYNDINQGNYKKFTGLKSYNKQLKTLIAIGGWNEGSKRFSKLVASPELRQTFVRSALKFLREHSFDGIDLDWEYPGFREGSSPDDREGYAQLIKELREAFDEEKAPNKERLLLTVAVPAGQDYIDQGFDIPLISQYVDFMNVLTYDYHTSFDPETNHHAPLTTRPDISEFDEVANKFNLEWTINYYLQLGAPREKLIVGVPTYGRSFTLADASNNGLGAPAEGPGEDGPSTREKGYMAFYEICQKIAEDGWEVKRPYPRIIGPYAFKDKQWVAFDDIEIIKDKARFILEKGLGGAMVWTLDNDDFRGICFGEQSPLVNALRSALLSNVVEGSSNEQARFARPAQSPPQNPPQSLFSSVQNRRQQSVGRRIYTTTTTTTTERTPAPTIKTTIEQLVRTTPEPPTTPEPAPPFECQDEGFFNNPKDCKKYFWCLDSGPANLGIVAHSFTCPSGLFFNSRTESCDYPNNVNCKIKSSSEFRAKPKPKPKLTTTTSTTTTTTTTTTEAPPHLPIEPDLTNAELLANILKQLNEKQSGRNNNNNQDNQNVAQLLQLVESLGGVDRIRSILANNNGQSDSQNVFNRVASPATSHNFFAPSYVTPNRNQEATLPPETATESSIFAPPNTPSGTRYGLPRNQVRPRRPQFEVQPTTLNPIFSFFETPRRPQQAPRTDIRGDASPGLPLTPQQGFSFSYNTPAGGRGELANVQPSNELRGNDARSISHQFQPINRSPALPSTSSLSIATESPRLIARTHSNGNNAFRIPIRVQSSGSIIRIPNRDNNLDNQNVNTRRNSRIQAPRLRIQNAFTPVEKPPGLFEENPDHRLVNPSQPIEPRNEPLHEVTTPKPAIRKRPPNRFNLLPPQENPVNALINLPPRAIQPLRPVSQPLEPEIRPILSPPGFHFPQDHLFVTPPPEHETTTPFNFNLFRSPSIPRFTNFNTLPPEFDIAPFTTSNPPFFEYTQTPSIVTTMPTTTTTTSTTTQRPINTPPQRRQFGRGQEQPRTRRPLVLQPQPQTVATTTRAPRREEPEELPSNFDGPPVFAENDGKLGCGKRGVYAHPSNCGMFVVCAPASRSNRALRSYMHDCPADQVFVQGIGRCRPGNKDKCEIHAN